MRALLVVALLVACTTTHKREVQLEQHQVEGVDAGGSLELHATADVFTRSITGAADVTLRDFAPLPDGGVYLVHEAVAHVEPSTTETTAKSEEQARSDWHHDAWLTSEMHGDEHQVDEMHPAASCAFGGYLWALALIGVALAALRIFRPRPPSL